MEHRRERLRQIIAGMSDNGRSNDEAKLALAELLLMARKIKISRQQFLRRSTSELDNSRGLCIPHLCLVNQYLKAKNYIFACHELEDVLHFMWAEDVGILSNIIQVLEMGLHEVDESEK